MKHLKKKKIIYLASLLVLTLAIYWLFTDGFSTALSENLGITKGTSGNVIEFLRTDVNPVLVILIVAVSIFLKYGYNRNIKKPKAKIMKKADIRKNKIQKPKK